MKSIVDGLETSDMLCYFMSAYGECENKITAGPQKGFAVTYKDDYGFEAENKYGVRIVFRPDISEGYIEIDHVKYPLNSEEFSRYRKKVPNVHNKNIDNRIDIDVVRILNSLGIYDKLLGMNLITMRNRGLYMFDSKCTKEFFSMDEDFLIWLFDNTSIRTSERFDVWFQALIINIYKKFGREIAEYFAMSFNKASIKFCRNRYYNMNFTASQFCDLMRDPKRTIDYLLFETYIQGIREIDIKEYLSYMEYVDENPELGLSRYPMNLESMYVKTQVYSNTRPDPETCFQNYKIIRCNRKTLPAHIPVFDYRSFSLIDKASGEIVAIFGDKWMKPVAQRELSQEEKDIVKAFRMKENDC